MKRGGIRQQLQLRRSLDERTPGLSIVVPIYNEAECLPQLVEKLYQVGQELGGPWELILVDDGSSDATAQWLADHPRDGLRVIRLQQNCGQSTAILVGLRARRFDTLATLDGDLQNDPSDLPKLLEALKNSDLVCGYRVDRQDSTWKRMVSRVANFIRGSLTGDGVRDTGCSLKVFRGEVADRLTFFRGAHRFLPALAQLEGFRVVEVGVRHHPRRAGKSKYGSLGRLAETVPDLLGFLWLRSRYPEYQAKESE